MIFKVVEFLQNRQYVELVQWAEQLLRTPNIKLSKTYTQVLTFLSQKKLMEVQEILRKIAFSTVKNESIALILKEIEERFLDIQLQWNFSEKFDKSQPFLNLILNNQIIIYQPSTIKLDKKIGSITELSSILSNPHLLSVGGNLYEMKGLSSIDTLQGILKDSNVQQEFQKNKKYERIVSFVEALELPLQELFSFHQIGIIIYENDVFLIKWVQYLDESQLINGTTHQNLDVTVLDNFGTTIGVQLKEDLSLGNLVVFSNKGIQHGKSILHPLLSLNESIFTSSKNKKSLKKWNLTQKEDCVAFVDTVIARIESGIMLLNKEKSAFVQNPKELDLYIKVSLQKIDAIDSTNQRINILRDLASLNKNPDNLPLLQNKLEENYIRYLKEVFQYNNPEAIPGLINIFVDLHLFRTRTSLLINTIVYLFDLYPAEPVLILNCIDLILKNWNCTPEFLKLLEKPQIIAITQEVIRKINQGNFSGVLTYITDYLTTHPYFRSYNLLTLIMQVMVNIFRQAAKNSSSLFDPLNFLQFFKEFVRLLHDSDKSLNESDLNPLIIILQDHLLTITQDVDFLSYMSKNIIEYLSLVQSIKPRFLRKKNFLNIIENIIRLAPLVMFQKNQPDINWKFYEFLVLLKNDDYIIQYFTQYVEIFTQSFAVLQKNPTLFHEATKFLDLIKKFVDAATLPKAFFIPLKKQIIQLLNAWYLSGQLPENDFDIHKRLITLWAGFADMSEKLHAMMNILYIKDLVWASVNGDVSLVEIKFKELPDSVFELSCADLIFEFKQILQRICPIPTQFAIIHYIFSLFQKEYNRLKMTIGEFQQIAGLFIQTTISSLIENVRVGDTIKFEGLIKELQDNLIYLPLTSYNELFGNLTEIFQFRPTEGDAFLARMGMIGILTRRLETLMSQYRSILDSQVKFTGSPEFFISVKELQQYLDRLKAGGLRIFTTTQEWLIKMCEENYATQESVFRPVKALFQILLVQFPSIDGPIVQGLLQLMDNFFMDQKMLNDNKKNFFKIMIELVPEAQYPNFYPQLRENKNFIDVMTDLESLYYTIKDRIQDKDKINNVLNRTKSIIGTHPTFFRPWFFYATALAILEKFNEAIIAYEEAAKYEATRGYYARLYHNLLVCHLNLKQYDQAVEIIKKMEIGIKSYPYISNIIRTVENQTGQTLLG